MKNSNSIDKISSDGTTSSIKFIQDDMQSLRAKKKRLVFKNIFDSPINYHWSKIDENLNNEILDELEKVLQPLKEFNKSNNGLKKERPEIMKNIYIGLNSITHILDKEINTSNEKKNINDRISIIIICKDDIKPTHLYTHLPMMSKLYGNIILCPLLAGSEQKLCNVTGLKRVSCIALKNVTSLNKLNEIISSKINSISIPWIIDTENIKKMTKYYTTNMKIIQTTAPIQTKKSNNNNKNSNNNCEKKNQNDNKNNNINKSKIKNKDNKKTININEDKKITNNRNNNVNKKINKKNDRKHEINNQINPNAKKNKTN